jgi:5'(3')-deoxyribonucleotidase
MNKLTIAFDMDSTLCNIIDPWLEDYNKEFNDNLIPEDILAFDIKKFIKPEARHKIFSYLTTKGFYKRVKPITDVVKIAYELYKQGHNIAICTAAMNNTVMMQDKLEWLEEHMSFVPERNIMFVSNKGLLRSDWLYDDKLENITDFLKNNPKSKGYLIRTPANREDIKNNTVYTDRIIISEEEY